MKNPKILVVEDDNDWQEIYRRCLSGESYDIVSARKVNVAIKLLQEETFDLVITDLKMAGVRGEFSGFGVLDEAKARNPNTQVIVITGFGSESHATQSLGNGASDYITKGPDVRHKLAVSVKTALAQSSQKQGSTNKHYEKSETSQIIGNSSSMRTLFEHIARAAENEFNVLIQGESGTGKQLIANTIHKQSSRWQGPFLVVDCGRLSETVLEAELFGYEAGTIYSTIEAHPGKFEQAETGTIFLDNFGDLDIQLQRHLIGAICDRKVVRIGGKGSIDIHARIIASTDKDLDRLSSEGRFERKLFDTLGEYVIKVPSLRQRKDGDDIPALAVKFLTHYQKGIPVTFSEEAIELIRKYDYPGNIRELESIVKHALSLSRGPQILAEHLRPELRGLQKTKDEQKNPYSILSVCPLNRGDCTKKEEILRLYSPRRVFVNIPYSSDYEEHEKAIRGTLESFGLVPVVSKDHLEPGMLLCNICKLLQTCKYGITDISDTGTNVFYELGLMHAIGIHCAILKDRRSSAISDIGGLLFLEYNNIQVLKEKLTLWIKTQVKEAVIPEQKRPINRSSKGSTSSPNVYIGENFQGNLIIGDKNFVSESDFSQSGISVDDVTKLFELLLAKIDQTTLLPQDKNDLKQEVDELRKELNKNEQADETFLLRRLRNIGRMAPDILEVTLTTITNPVAGFGLVAKKIAEKSKTKTEQD